MSWLETSEKEAASVAKNTNRVTLADLHDRVVKVEYFYSDTLTICVATLDTGYKLVGESACIDPANYNKELGEKFAYERCIQQMWPLEGYHRLAS